MTVSARSVIPRARIEVDVLLLMIVSPHPLRPYQSMPSSLFRSFAVRSRLVFGIPRGSGNPDLLPRSQPQIPAIQKTFVVVRKGPWPADDAVLSPFLTLLMMSLDIDETTIPMTWSPKVKTCVWLWRLSRKITVNMMRKFGEFHLKATRKNRDLRVAVVMSVTVWLRPKDIKASANCSVFIYRVSPDVAKINEKQLGDLRQTEPITIRLANVPPHEYGYQRSHPWRSVVLGIKVGITEIPLFRRIPWKILLWLCLWR